MNFPARVVRISIMQPLKTYEYLALARQRIFDWTRPLTNEQYTRQFPIGRHGTLASTLTHILISEWYYVERIQGNDVPPYAQWKFQDENPPPFAALESEWIEQAKRTKIALATTLDWKTELEYRVKNDDSKEEIIIAAPSDIFTQLVLHEVHHRAQAMNILRQLGIAAEDLDFNAMMYKRRTLSE